MNTHGNDRGSIEQFMFSYRRGTHPSQHSAERVAEVCKTALRQAGVLHEIKYSTTESTRLEGELKVREIVRRRHYERNGEIEEEVVDLAGVSVHVPLPQQKGHVREIIRQAFKVHWGSVDRREDMGMELDPTDGRTEYYWVSLRQEERLSPLRMVEIQVKTEDKQFQSQHQLGIFLDKWAALKGRGEDCGDIQPLWEVLKVLNRRHHRDLWQVLEQLGMSGAQESEYLRKVRAFAPLELSLAMYVTDAIIRSPWGIDRLHDTASFQQSGPESRKQRYQMRIVRDSFIWLTRFWCWDEGAAEMLFDGLDKTMQARQRQQIIWLDEKCTRSFYDDDENTILSADENKDLQELWRIFENHRQQPVQFVFNLARLEVKCHRLPGWHHYHKAIVDLVYNNPDHLSSG